MESYLTDRKCQVQLAVGLLDHTNWLGLRRFTHHGGMEG